MNDYNTIINEALQIISHLNILLFYKIFSDSHHAVFMKNIKINKVASVRFMLVKRRFYCGDKIYSKFTNRKGALFLI